MKHLKIYEIFNNKPNPITSEGYPSDILKRYVVYKNPIIDIYVIYEIIRIESLYVIIKYKYKYRISTGEIDDLTDLTLEHKEFISTFLTQIKFQSDDILDCKNYLDLMMNANKYNL